MIGLISFAAVAIGLVLLIFDLIYVGLFDVLFAVAMGNTAIALLSKLGARPAIATGVGVAIPVLALGAQWFFPSIRLSPYLAIIIINAFVAYIFGRGLARGRTPLIVQLIRIGNSGPEGPPRFQNYVYGQGWVWTVFGVLTAAMGLIAMLFEPTRSVLDTAISGLFCLQIVWFIAAHQWARTVHKRPETFVGTIRIMAHPATWSELEI